jgi:hypothetical protein
MRHSLPLLSGKRIERLRSETEEAIASYYYVGRDAVSASLPAASAVEIRRARHRPGFEEDSEGQREAHRKIGDVGDRIVGGKVMEGLHGYGNPAASPYETVPNMAAV